MAEAHGSAPTVGAEEAVEFLLPFLDAKDADISEAAMEAMAILGPDGNLDEDDDWEDDFFKDLEEERKPSPRTGNTVEFHR